MLVNIFNEPILFLQYYHPSVVGVRVEEEGEGELNNYVLMTTMYGERIPLNL